MRFQFTAAFASTEGIQHVDAHDAICVVDTMLDGHLWLAISRLHLQTPRPLVIESVAIGCASMA